MMPHFFKAQLSFHKWIKHLRFITAKNSTQQILSKFKSNQNVLKTLHTMFLLHISEKLWYHFCANLFNFQIFCDDFSHLFTLYVQIICCFCNYKTSITVQCEPSTFSIFFVCCWPSTSESSFTFFFFSLSFLCHSKIHVFAIAAFPKTSEKNTIFRLVFNPNKKTLI